MSDQSELVLANLADYSAGNLSIRELDALLSEWEYDDELSASFKDRLAVIRLAIIEAGEGDVSQDEVLREVNLLLAPPTGAPRKALR